MSRPDELRLYQILDNCKQVHQLHGNLVPVQPYGVLLCLGRRPLGIWSLHQGRFVFRDLANYEPSRSFADVDGVHRQTLALLTSCRGGWAEHFGSNHGVELVA